MLFGSMGAVGVSANSAIAWLSEQATPTELGGPSTLELALIGIGTLAVYAAVRRYRRPATMPSDEPFAGQIADVTTVDGVMDEPSRGAA